MLKEPPPDGTPPPPAANAAPEPSTTTSTPKPITATRIRPPNVYPVRPLTAEYGSNAVLETDGTPVTEVRSRTRTRRRCRIRARECRVYLNGQLAGGAALRAPDEATRFAGAGTAGRNRTELSEHRDADDLAGGMLRSLGLGVVAFGGLCLRRLEGFRAPVWGERAGPRRRTRKRLRRSRGSGSAAGPGVVAFEGSAEIALFGERCKGRARCVVGCFGALRGVGGVMSRDGVKNFGGSRRLIRLAGICTTEEETRSMAGRRLYRPQRTACHRPTRCRTQTRACHSAGATLG